MSILEQFKKQLPQTYNKYLFLQGYTPQEILESSRQQILEQAQLNNSRDINEAVEQIANSILNRYLFIKLKM